MMLNSFDINLESYQLKYLSEDWLDTIYQKKWFKIFLPRSLNGLEADLWQGLKIMFEAASIHGSLGWCINLGSGASYFAGFMQEQVAQKMLGSPKAVIAGSGQVGQAIQQNHAYEITGLWDKCSGAAHATAFTVNAQLKDGSQTSFILPASQVTIRDNWSHFALKGSSSFSIKIQQALIPRDHSFEIGKQQSFFDYPIYRIPFLPFAQCSMFASLLGMVDCFQKHLIGIPKLPLNRIQTLLNNLENIKLSSLSELERITNLYWEHAINNQIDTIEKDSSLKALIPPNSFKIYQLIQQIFYEVGLYLADENQLAHYAYRDVILAAQHFLLK